MEAFSFTHLRALCCIDICGDELFMLSGLHPFDSVIYVTDSRGEIRGEVRSNRAACLVGRTEEAYESSTIVLRICGKNETMDKRVTYIRIVLYVLEKMQCKN